MFKHLLKVRYIVVVIVILAVLHAFAFLAMGTLTTVKAYRLLLGETAEGGDPPRPGLELLHSLDFLFVAMVLLVFALGTPSYSSSIRRRGKPSSPALAANQEHQRAQGVDMGNHLTTL